MCAELVLVVGDDLRLLRQLTEVLNDAGYQTLRASAADSALPALENHRFLFTLVEAGPQGPDPGLISCLRSEIADPGPIVLVATGAGIPPALKAAARLADGLIEDPFDRVGLEASIEDLVARHTRARGRVPEKDEAARCRREMALWCSPKMAEVRQVLQRAAEVDVTVLITGVTGTGKCLVARAIHYLSFRKHRPFLKVNCAAVPRELLESELFGHERGAFTGAYQLKIGKFEAADHGTIFLDEIGDLHPSLQAKLLHVLQDGEFSRIGGRSTIKVDVRVLAATNQDLERAVAAGRFREDLYYRLNVVQIALPPLRERAEEIPLLAQYFVERYARLFGREGFTLSAAAIERMVRHPFPGNVRELENLVKRAIVLDDRDLTRTLATAPVPHESRAPGPPSEAAVSLKEISRHASRAAEREAIARVLETTGWNRTKAAPLLQISYRALLYKIKETGLDRDDTALGDG